MSVEENPYRSPTTSGDATPRESRKPREPGLFDLPVMIAAAVIIIGLVMVVSEFAAAGRDLSFRRLATGFALSAVAFLFLRLR
jgi:hypothetical protein